MSCIPCLQSGGSAWTAVSYGLLGFSSLSLHYGNSMLQKDLHRSGSRSGHAGRSRQDARAQLAARVADWIRTRVFWGAPAGERGRRALGIVARGDRIEKVAPDRHTVRSQTDESTTYSVVRRRSSWSCDCPDHRFRNAQCKHILAVMSLVEAEAEAQNGHAGGSEAAALEEALAEAWRTPVPAGKGETAAVSRWMGLRIAAKGATPRR